MSLETIQWLENRLLELFVESPDQKEFLKSLEEEFTTHSPLKISFHFPFDNLNFGTNNSGNLPISDVHSKKILEGIGRQFHHFFQSDGEGISENNYSFFLEKTSSNNGFFYGFIPIKKKSSFWGWCFFRWDGIFNPELRALIENFLIKLGVFLEKFDPFHPNHPYIKFINDFLSDVRGSVNEEKLFPNLAEKLMAFFGLDYIYFLYPTISKNDGFLNLNFNSNLPQVFPTDFLRKHKDMLLDLFKEARSGDFKIGHDRVTPNNFKPRIPWRMDQDFFQVIPCYCDGVLQGVVGGGVLAPESPHDVPDLNKFNSVIQPLGSLFEIIFHKSRDEHRNSFTGNLNTAGTTILQQFRDISLICKSYAWVLETYFKQQLVGIYYIENSSNKIRYGGGTTQFPYTEFPEEITDPQDPIAKVINSGAPLTEATILFKKFPVEKLIPIVLSDNRGVNQCFGVVIFILDSLNKVLNQEEHNLLMGFHQNVSGAMLNHHWYKKDREKIPWLSKMGDIVDTILNEKTLFKAIISQVIEEMEVQTCSIMILDESGEYLEVRESFGLPDELSKITRVRLGEDISGTVALEKRSRLISNIENDSRFKRRNSERFYTKSLISVPILISDENGKEKILGVININNKKDHTGFKKEDLEKMEGLSHYLGKIIKNHIQIFEIDRAKEVAQQLGVAKTIQDRLMPKSFPDHPCYQAWGTSVPAREIGGDYFNLHTEAGFWFITIMDVSGKGIPAALLAARAQAYLQVGSHKGESSPALMLTFINQLISKNMEPDRFITGQHVVLNLNTHQIKIGNAGHMPLLFFRKRNQSIEEIHLRGLALGILEDYNLFETMEKTMEKGDFIALFTDGISEARGENGQEFGMERFKSVLKGHSQKDPRSICQEVIGEIKKFSRGDPHDDTTLLIVKRVN